jgi:hypothetical protein
VSLSKSILNFHSLFQPYNLFFLWRDKTLGYNGRGGHGYGNQKHGRSGWKGSGKAKRDTKLAMSNFKDRSKRSQSQDLRMTAPIAIEIFG